MVKISSLFKIMILTENTDDFYEIILFESKRFSNLVTTSENLF